MILLIFNDFENQLLMLAAPKESDIGQIAIDADGCYINQNNEDYSEQVQDFVSDLSCVNAYKATGQKDYIETVNQADYLQTFIYNGDSELLVEKVVHCGFLP